MKPTTEELIELIEYAATVLQAHLSDGKPCSVGLDIALSHMKNVAGKPLTPRDQENIESPSVRFKYQG